MADYEDDEPLWKRLLGHGCVQFSLMGLGAMLVIVVCFLIMRTR